MANHPWTFNFPPDCSLSDLKLKDLYELIIKAVAVGTQEAVKTDRISGTGQTADQVAAALNRGRTTELIRG